MRFNKLDLNLLVALDAMLTERSISRAAERMHVTQSGMSSALARLRQHLDDELLVQVGRKLTLTPRAEILKVAVRDVLMRIDVTINAQSEFVPAESDRVFRLLVSDYTTTVLMPHVLQLASEESSTIGFELMPQQNLPEQLLEHGEADVLISPRMAISPDHPSELLFTERYVCVVWKDHPEIGDHLTIDQYLSADHVAARHGMNKAPSFDVWFLGHHGVGRKIGVTTSYLATPCSLVAGTRRIATVQERLALSAAASMPVKILPMPMEVPPFEQMVQWHTHRQDDPGLVWLRDLLRRAVVRMAQ